MILILVGTCSPPTIMELTNGNIASTTPNAVVTQTNTRTLTCATGWLFADLYVSNVFTCTGLETYSPALQYCTGKCHIIVTGSSKHVS